MTRSIGIMVAFGFGMYLSANNPELASDALEYGNRIREIIHQLTATK